IALPAPSSTPSAPDRALTYTDEPLDAGSAARVVAWPMGADGTPGVFVADDAALRRVGAQPASWPFAGVDIVVPLDWNHDFRTDLLLAGNRGSRLLLQDGEGMFADAPRAALGVRAASLAVAGAWTADLDMDGDLDLILGVVGGEPLVIRNNGDGTSRELRSFRGVDGARGFAWGDLDRDGDPDAAMLDAAGSVHLFTNQQSGVFELRQPPSSRAGSRAVVGAAQVTPIIALALGDANADGIVDILTLDARGAVRRSSAAASSETRVMEQSDEQQIATWNGLPVVAAPGTYRISLADLDNNGGLDLVAAGGGASRLWLADERGALDPLPAAPDTEISSVLDLNADGMLDLVGVSAGRPVRLLARGTQPYHWQVIRARATMTLGDQRINAFGVGGEVEIRSGLLLQKQLLTGAPVHVGLGTRAAVDVARFVWPNGVVQAEFDLRVDQPVVAEQRLKGSCPWVFAYNGEEMGFVTDFLWRSPLGLRINAQDTAGVTETEDWVKIRGDQLVPRDGMYDVRITAELWETHFFDHVSLMVVDHPSGSEVFVDERFAREAPKMALHAMSALRPVAGAWDDQRLDVTGEILALDGRHAAGFERGAYQGLTREHALEIELDDDVPDRGALWLVAQGWVYPTDSSINVAIGQGSVTPPHGLVLEMQEPGGAWRMLDADLGFPAGKNKTILIDLSKRPTGARRVRLRTNMEVYWDRLAWALPAPDARLRQTHLSMSRADLQYRGFSSTSEDRTAHAPELPRYAELANTAPRWRDLIGYHTRFGDVSALLARTDDRYVIMNAGDELRLSFQAPPAPPAGWVRDFVLVGDGWEKDGDYNTGYSKTVQPLPLHDRPEYTAPGGSLELRDDPAYLRHPEDWQTYHTRFVSPDRYLRGLFPSKGSAETQRPQR
ncbi:MAG: CRTAC1 family protein, partial [Vicinamibacterales bacterium]